MRIQRAFRAAAKADNAAPLSEITSVPIWVDCAATSASCIPQSWLMRLHGPHARAVDTALASTPGGLLEVSKGDEAEQGGITRIDRFTAHARSVFALFSIYAGSCGTL